MAIPQRHGLILAGSSRWLPFSRPLTFKLSTPLTLKEPSAGGDRDHNSEGMTVEHCSFLAEQCRATSGDLGTHGGD